MEPNTQYHQLCQINYIKYPLNTQHSIGHHKSATPIVENQPQLISFTTKK